MGNQLTGGAMISSYPRGMAEEAEGLVVIERFGSGKMQMEESVGLQWLTAGLKGCRYQIPTTRPSSRGMMFRKF